MMAPLPNAEQAIQPAEQNPQNLRQVLDSKVVEVDVAATALKPPAGFKEETPQKVIPAPAKTKKSRTQKLVPEKDGHEVSGAIGFLYERHPKTTLAFVWMSYGILLLFTFLAAFCVWRDVTQGPGLKWESLVFSTPILAAHITLIGIYFGKRIVGSRGLWLLRMFKSKSDQTKV
jgi:hypothetical protein